MEYPDWLTKEHLEQQFRTKAEQTALADYGDIYANGEFNPLRYSACHAGWVLSWDYKWSAICHSYIKKTRQLSATLEPVYRDLGIDWMTWFIGPESPWRDVAERLVIKDPEWCWDYGLVLGPTKGLPGNLVYGFVIASRFMTEKRKYVENWKALREAGVHPSLAYWMSHVSCIGQIFCGGHKAVSVGNIDEEYVSNFIQGIRVNPSSPKSRLDVDDLWGKPCSDDRRLPRFMLANAHGNLPGTYVRKLSEIYPDRFTHNDTNPGYYTYTPGTLGRFPKTPEDLAKIGLMEQVRLGLVKT